MNKQNFINILIEMNTDKGANRLIALQTFLIEEPDFFTKDERDSLLSLFKDKIVMKSQSSKNNITKRWEVRKANNQKKQAKKWLFVAKSPFTKICENENCSEKYLVEDPIWIDQTTKPKKGYHEQCMPEPEAKEFDHFYQQWSKNGKTNE